MLAGDVCHVASALSVLYCPVLTDQYLNKLCMMIQKDFPFCMILPQLWSRKYSEFKSFLDLLVHCFPLTLDPRPALGDSADLIIFWPFRGEGHDEIFCSWEDWVYFSMCQFSSWLILAMWMKVGWWSHWYSVLFSFIYLFFCSCQN